MFLSCILNEWGSNLVPLGWTLEHVSVVTSVKNARSTALTQQNFVFVYVLDQQNFVYVYVLDVNKQGRARS